MRIASLLGALGLVVALAGCESVKVSVDCVTVAGPAVNCDVKQTEGKSEVEVCWDFAVTCDNGTKVTAPRSCAKVKDGGTTHLVIPGDKLTDADKCDSGPKATVSNLTLNGKKSE
jgi:hypothetical protein